MLNLFKIVLHSYEGYGNINSSTRYGPTGAEREEMSYLRYYLIPKTIKAITRCFQTRQPQPLVMGFKQNDDGSFDVIVG